MGQQESYAQEGASGATSGGSATTSEDAAVDRPMRPATASSTSHTGRRRVDKLLRRAQNTLEARLRGRDRSASPSLGKTARKDAKARLSGSMEPSPTPDDSQPHNRPDESHMSQDSDVETNKLELRKSAHVTSLHDEVKAKTSGGRSDDERYCMRPSYITDEPLDSQKDSKDWVQDNVPAMQNGHEEYLDCEHQAVSVGANREKVAHSQRTKDPTYTPKFSISDLKERRPEELESHLVPLVTIADMGLSPIEEKSSTPVSKSTDDICAINSDMPGSSTSESGEPKPLTGSHQSSYDASVNQAVSGTSGPINDGASSVEDVPCGRTGKEQTDLKKMDNSFVVNMENGHKRFRSGKFKHSQTEQNASFGSSSEEFVASSLARSSVDNMPEDPCLTMPKSRSSSIGSSMSEHAYADPMTDESPGESSYVSATENHISMSSQSCQESSDEESDAVFVNGATPQGSRMSQSFTEAKQTYDVEPEFMQRKAVSEDNLDKSPTGGLTHFYKPVEASYPVNTSRRLSGPTSQKTRGRVSSDVVSGRQLTPSPSPCLKRKKAAASEQDINNLEARSNDNEDLQKASSHSYSFDSGLDSASRHPRDVSDMMSDAFVTNVREATFDFTRQIRLLDDTFLGGEPSLDQFSNLSEHDTGANIMSRSLFQYFDARSRHQSSAGDSDAGRTGTKTPSRSVSLSDVVVRPQVIEKLDFKKLEKFEGNPCITHILVFVICWVYVCHHYTKVVSYV